MSFDTTRHALVARVHFPRPVYKKAATENDDVMQARRTAVNLFTYEALEEFGYTIAQALSRHGACTILPPNTYYWQTNETRFVRKEDVCGYSFLTPYYKQYILFTSTVHTTTWLLECAPIFIYKTQDASDARESAIAVEIMSARMTTDNNQRDESTFELQRLCEETLSDSFIVFTSRFSTYNEQVDLFRAPSAVYAQRSYLVHHFTRGDSFAHLFDALLYEYLKLTDVRIGEKANKCSQALYAWDSLAKQLQVASVDDASVYVYTHQKRPTYGPWIQGGNQDGWVQPIRNMFFQRLPAAEQEVNRSLCLSWGGMSWGEWKNCDDESLRLRAYLDDFARCRETRRGIKGGDCSYYEALVACIPNTKNEVLFHSKPLVEHVAYLPLEIAH